MNIVSYEGKDEAEALNLALEELQCKEEDILYYKTTTKVGLLKKELTSVHVAKLEDVVQYIKDFLGELLKTMGLDVTFESKIREKQITIKMYSDHNSILIGKNGQTLQALSTIVKQMVYNQIKQYPYLLLDVENYKEKQEKYLERLANNVAKDVARTKVEVILEDMNSYERRIIHNALADSKDVYTISEGEEPNRHIVVKPKED